MEDEPGETNRLRPVVEDSTEPQGLYVDSWLLFAMFGLNLELLPYFEMWCSVNVEVRTDAFRCGFLLFFRGPTSSQDLAMSRIQSRMEQLRARRLLVAVIVARDLHRRMRPTNGFI